MRAVWLMAAVVLGCAGGSAGPSLGSGNSAGRGTGASDAAGSGGDAASSAATDSASGDDAAGGADAAPAKLPELSKEVLDFGDKLAAAVCKKAADCQSAAFHFGSLELCKQKVLAGWHLEHWALLVGQGKAVLSGDNAPKCIADLSATCDALWGPPSSACRIALHGTAQKSQPCTQGLCATTVCLSSAGLCGSCADATADGGTCSGDATCDPAFVCAGGVCKAVGSVKAGGPCSHDYDCAAGSACVAKTCAARLAEGSPCKIGSKPCKAGLVCRADKPDGAPNCQAPAKQGQACFQVKLTKNADNECDTGLRCSFEGDLSKVSVPQGTCLPLAKFGDACKSVFQCGPYAVCQGGKCKPFPAAGEACASEPNLQSEPICGDGLVCNTGTGKCKAGGKSGEYCTDSGGCQTGYFCDDKLTCRPLGLIGAKCDYGAQTGCDPALQCDEDNTCRMQPKCLGN